MQTQASKVNTAKATKSGGFPVLGCGIGLRPEHYTHILENRPKTIDWFEAVSENYMGTGGRPLSILKEIRENYPIALHGVALSIGSADPINVKYLKQLKDLADLIEPAIISDHICWSSIHQYELHDLLPLPFTEEALNYLVNRVEQVQESLKSQILLENVSTYVTYKHSMMPEWEFIRELAKRSGCGLLIDINNVFVNSCNHHFDAQEYLDAIPGEYVGQFHIAGHLNMGKFLFDTHEGPILDDVWALYDYALKRYGKVSSLIEWDTDIPDFEKLEDENLKSRSYYDKHPIKQADEIIQTEPNSHSSIAAPKMLEQLQNEFGHVVRHAKTSAEETKMISEALNPQSGDPGIDRLIVYADGYKARTEEALTETFESVKHLVGDARFHNLSIEYALAHPSQSFNLGDRGIQFVDFLAGHAITNEYPFLTDLASFEWKKSRVFHAIFQNPAGIEPLQTLDPQKWGSVRFEFQSFISTFSSKWPIYDLWQARHTPIQEIDIQLENKAQNVFIYRVGDEVKVQLIDSVLESFTNSLIQGETLGNACEALAKSENPPALNELFSQWIHWGLITKIRVD